MSNDKPTGKTYCRMTFPRGFWCLKEKGHTDDHEVVDEASPRDFDWRYKGDVYPTYYLRRYPNEVKK